MIWSLLDGSSSVDQLGDAVSGLFDLAFDDARPAVIGIVEGLAAQGLLGNPKDRPQPTPPLSSPETGPSLVPVSPSPCMARHDQLGWASQSTYQLGSFYLGVRASDSTYEAALAKALAAHLVPGVVAPANYSIRLPQGKGLGLLYQTYQPVVRTGDPGRLTWALLRYLGSYAQKPSGLLLGMAAVIRGGEALLVPRSVSNLEYLRARQLARAGIQFLDSPTVDIDLDRAELTVTEPELTWDPSPLNRWLEGEQESAVPAGTYPVVGFVIEANPGSSKPHLYWIAQALRRAQNLKEFGPEKAVGDLLDLADRVPVHTALPDPQELAAAVAAAW